MNNDVIVINVVPRERKLNAEYKIEYGQPISLNTKKEWEILASELTDEEWDRLVNPNVRKSDYEQ